MVPVRLDDLDAGDTFAWALEGSGAQCLAVDPQRAETVYVGCRGGGLTRTHDGGDSWEQLALPERDVFSVAAGAFRRGRGPRTCAGSRPTRTTPDACWSASSSVA